MPGACPQRKSRAARAFSRTRARKRSATYGAFALRAASLPLPDSVTLKDPRAFSLIGTKLPRVDVAAKIDGSAVFALDVVRENMLTAVLPGRRGSAARSNHSMRAPPRRLAVLSR